MVTGGLRVAGPGPEFGEYLARDGLDGLLAVRLARAVVGQYRQHVIAAVPGDPPDAVDLPVRIRGQVVRQPAVLQRHGDARRNAARDAPDLVGFHVLHQVQAVTPAGAGQHRVG